MVDKWLTIEYCLKDIWMLLLFGLLHAFLFLISYWVQHQKIRLSRDTGLFWDAFRLLWKLMKSNPHPTVLDIYWRISMGHRALHWLLCLFMITSNGTEEYQKVFTPGWFLTPKWCNSSRGFEDWCYSADLLFVCPLEPGLQAPGRRLLSHGFRKQSKTGI